MKKIILYTSLIASLATLCSDSRPSNTLHSEYTDDVDTQEIACRSLIAKIKYLNEKSNQLGKVVCPKCDLTLASNRSLRIHEKSVHGKIWHACTRCDKEFTKECIRKQHEGSVHDGIRYKCPQCPQDFSSTANVNRHIKSAHENTKPSICKKCNGAFRDASELRRHQRNVHKLPIEDQSAYFARGINTLRKK